MEVISPGGLQNSMTIEKMIAEQRPARNLPPPTHHGPTTTEKRTHLNFRCGAATLFPSKALYPCVKGF
jgi:hypothetical protein